MRILITGASRGIGRAAAVLLAQQGHEVILSARNRQALSLVERAVREKGGMCSVVPVDVTQDDSVRDCARLVLAGGGLDVLVNNAGSLDQEVFLSQAEETRRAEFELNYFGALRMMQAFVPSMRERREGTIVNVSSILGKVGTATTANYGATKAALEVFSTAVRPELEPFGVKVLLFVAPHTDTDLGARADFRGVKSAKVEDVAQELVWTIEKKLPYHGGSAFLRNGLRMARWFPSFMGRQLNTMVSHRL